MATLYELKTDYLEIQQLIEDGAEGLEDTLESLEAAIEDKLEGIGKVCRNLDGEVAALKAEEKRLADKRKSIENNMKRLKQYAQDTMLDSDMKKVKTPLFTFNIQKNAPSVSVIDDALIPKHYYVPVDPRLDKKGILERLKAGESIPGVELQQTESIRIK